MIDTLNINTNDFEIDMSKNQCSEYPLTAIRDYNLNPLEETNSNRFLMYDKNCNKIYGNGLTLARSAENLNGTLRNTGIIKVGKFGLANNDDLYLSIQSSVPKFLTGKNFYLANCADIVRYKKELADTLNDMGIYCNLDKMKVSRLDLTKNIETKYNFGTYTPVLKMCNANKNFQSEINASTYTTGTGKGKSNQICCYDKLEEISNNGELIPQGLENSNIFRCESKFLKHNTIYTKTGIQTFSDIQKNYFDLQEVYKNNVQKNLFGNFDKDKLKDFQIWDFQSVLPKFIQENETGKGKKSWVCNFIFALMAKYSQEPLKQLFDDVPFLLDCEKEYLLKQGKDLDTIKQYRSRHKKEFMKILGDIFSMIENEFNVPYMRLLEELQEKLCA